MAIYGALANFNPDEAIARIANGAIPSRIATELGVTKAAIYYHLADHPDWAKARKIGMAIRLDNAENSINDVDGDQLTLSRARESFRAVAWRAEREFPDDWGGRATQVTVTVNTLAVGDIGRVSDLLVQVGAPALEDLVRDAGVTED
jgi:AcrR family transcriptional regulator